MFDELANTIGLSLTNTALYEQAFTHRSYLNEHPEVTGHNERLEFLGDAVVELIVTQFLYAKFPDKPEGELTNLRAALVRRNTLSEIGKELHFENYLRLSKGEAGNADKAKSMILSNAAEAFIGALFLDQGLPAVDKFLKQFLLPRLEAIVKAEEHIDAKSRFQEIVQEQDGTTPHYKLEQTTGPDHDRIFTVGLYVGNKKVATGTGTSKREAEMNAAAQALEKQS
ncbi:TPA: ribonuclease III [Patescibacteria group bacterium]|uniref:Ribonuclease 3 n=2 Tax=Bacteria division Kazan-3B-28 TaxID=1798534 RepID=A0A0G1X772_UNCK3|nr:MAG: putative ribonuclease III [candidate division Kazan bacterium GW2011_GWA1_50_15]KKW25525.1 MAG: Ribonuclease 3 [candidate division Kazan bacterium GW2011_GWC1_52_13]KKW26831.1 MAG: Ribonuclease 3 [candidate division Kazan bacterium GW2011_GWB1_52_7]HAV65824.1 ribonuclease III [Patescibacteria group bacterium]HCL47696.1 ribonuclease III [Patescibacteria group bacterium]